MRLSWTNTGLGAKTDYTGRDPDRPQAFCRVYLSRSPSSERPWFWTASDGCRDFGTGYEADAKAAAHAAEAAYQRTRSTT